MRLKEFLQLTVIIRFKSPFHIGSGEKGHYGEPSSVIKSLQTQLPYIPGSSIKGKLRHLLETTYAADRIKTGQPCGCGKCQICLLFGSGKSDSTKEPSRLIFRDCFLPDESASLIEKIGTEKKAGVRIDRKTGKAADKALYSVERIPEGCEFDLNVSARIFEGDDKNAMKQWLITGLSLLEQDAIGGGGTRGSGWVEIKAVKFDGKEIKNWREEVKEHKDKLVNMKIKQ